MQNSLAGGRGRAVLSRAMSSARALFAALLLLVPATARPQAITFGANLNRPVNYRFDCGVGPGVGAFGEQILYPSNVGNCTWLAIGTNFGQAEGLLVPNGVGTITQVRIKVGPITGPMQVVILRALRKVAVDPSGENAFCCFEMARSTPFTPNANAINTVATNLPVLAEIGPAPGADMIAFDAVALSVLQAGVPVPAHDTGVYNEISGPSALLFFPAFRPGGERADGFGTSGYQLLMEATWVPNAGGGGGGGTTPAGVVLAQPVATQQQNFLLLSLLCNQANPCVGAIRVQNQGAAGGGVVTNGRAKKPRTITFAKSDFTIPAGQTQQVPIKLTKKGKKMVKKSQRPTLYANLVIDGKPSMAGTIDIAP
jgi:hypothetical protein